MIFTRATLPNLFRAANKALRSLFANDEYTLATDGVQAVRELRCNHCLHYVKDSDQCKLCTCVVALKTMIATERCPDDPPRWREQTKKGNGL